MTIDTNDLLNSILQSLKRIDYIHPEEIPNIDLYMDQVTTFMETQLRSTKRYEQDKILTKTMIAPSACEEKIFQRTSFGADLYLLF